MGPSVVAAIKAHAAVLVAKEREEGEEGYGDQRVSDSDSDDELCDAVTYEDILPGQSYAQPWGCGCALTSETLGATYRSRREQLGVARISPKLLGECPGCGWTATEDAS